MQVKCLNCNTDYTGHFCPECGQKSHTHRITLATILHDIPHSVFHVDKGLLFTFVQLLYRPGKAIKEYIAGKRVNYFSPFAYLFFLCAVSTLLTHQAHYHLPEHLEESKAVPFPRMAVFFVHYPALMMSCLAPIIALWSWLFNLDKQYNYWENVILNVYIVAQFNLFFILFSILHLFYPAATPSYTPFIVCYMAYLAVAYHQFFDRKYSFLRVVKGTILFLAIALTLITALSVAGFMTPWWLF